MQKTLYVVGGGDLSDYIACKRGGGGCQAAVIVNTHHAETDISTNRVCLWKRSIEHGSSLSTPLQWTQIAVFIVWFKIILAMSVVPISKYAHFSLFLCVSLCLSLYSLILNNWLTCNTYSKTIICLTVGTPCWINSFNWTWF